MKWFLALWLIIPMAMIVISAVGIRLCVRELRTMPDWATRSALVTNIASEEDPDHPGRARQFLTVTYTYRDTNGQEYEGRGPLRVQKNVTAGGTVQIQVDPSDPGRSRLLAAPRVAFKAGIAFAVVLMVIGVVNLISQVTDLLAR